MSETARAQATRTVTKLTDTAGFDLFQDRENLYWMASAEGAEEKYVVWRLPKAGGAPSSLAEVSAYVNDVDVRDPAHIYLSADKVLRIAKSGGAAEVFSSESGSTLSSDATYLYLKGYDSIVKRPKSGGGDAIPVAKLMGDSLILDGGTFFYADSFGNSGVMAMSSDGGAARQLTTETPTNRGVLAVGANLYFATAEGRILRVSREGGAVTELTVAADLASRLATDGESLVFITASRKIQRVGFDGGAVTTLGLAPELPGVADGTYSYALVADDQGIYFSISLFTADGTTKAYTARL